MTRGRRHRPGFRPHLVRLESRDTPTAVGALDPRFDTDGKVILPTDSTLVDVAVQPDGRTVAVGTTSGTGGVPTDFLVVRFLPDGTLDETFGAGGQRRVDFGGQSDRAQSVALFPDGSIVVAGFSSAGAAPTDTAIARLSATGTVQTQRLHAIGGAGVFDGATAVAVNATSGEVYAAGFGPGGPYAARFGADLGLLGSTTLALGPSGSASGVAVEAGGRVFVSGSNFAAGVNNMAVARLNADLSGVVTNTAIGGGFNADVAVDSVTDRVYLIGTTNFVVGVPTRALLVQLNTDLGETNRTNLDFGGSSSNGVDVAVDSRGRVVVAATSTVSTANADFAVARLRATDLGFDPTFDGDGKQTVQVTASENASAVAVGPRDSVTVVGSTVANPGAPGATANPALVRLAGSVDLPTTVLAGGPTDGTAAAFGLDSPNADRSNQDRYVPTDTGELIPGLSQNVRVAVGDVNGDGVDDFVAGAGPGAVPRVRVTDGKTGNAITDFLAFEGTFTGGVYVAAGDIDGDGFAEVVVTPDQTGGPVVAIYSGAKLAAGEGNGQPLGGTAQLIRYLGIDDENFRGGARAAVGDVNNDGVLDIVVSAGFLGGPRITVWDGKQLLAGTRVQLANFFAFEESVRNGAFVASGDVNGDGSADLIFGGGPTGGPRVRVASGKALLTAPISSLDTATTPGLQIGNFIVGDPNSRGGVRLAAKDVDGDNLADVVTGSGDNLAANAFLIRGATLKANPGSPGIDQTLAPFGGTVLANGVFVG